MAVQVRVLKYHEYILECLMDANSHALKYHWQKQQRQLKQMFLSREHSITKLIKTLALSIDQNISSAYQHVIPKKNQHCYTVIAVGGYGRVEIFPHSDIDLLILCAESKPGQAVKHSHIEQFIQACWDIGLPISHSTRTITQCLQQARHDVTVFTNLIEARFITGFEPLFTKLTHALDTQNMWTYQDFLTTRLEKLNKRYKKYGKSAYCIEPDIKYSPGGLRDLQMSLWLAKFRYGIHHLNELVEKNILLIDEYRQLSHCQHFLWKIRFGLHIFTDRQENRLLLDHQKQLAIYFGFEDESYNIAVELFMKQYYQTIKTLNEINALLLQTLQQVPQKPLVKNSKPIFLGAHSQFLVEDNCIQAVKKNLFEQHPESLLEIFVVMAKHPTIKQIDVQTKRLIVKERHRINQSYREKAKHRKLFAEIVRHPNRIAFTLNLMHDLGVLGQYLPAFNKIIGQTQFDLYHVYPVDKHVLLVLQQLHHFTLFQHDKEFDLCHQIMKQLNNSTCLFVAAFFHDIGKGQGQDHSILGTTLAAQFCVQHYFSDEETHLITWLVNNHLLMSMVAQRQDISDPDTLRTFAEQCTSQEYLNALYLLTVADIIATNSSLWNGWRDSLLKRLYYGTTTWFQQSQAVDSALLVKHSQESVITALHNSPYGIEQLQALWANFEKFYFLSHNPDTLKWHAEVLLHADSNYPLVAIHSALPTGNEILIYCEKTPHLFAITATLLDRLQINIVNASFTQTKTNKQIASYFVVDHSGQTITDNQTLGFITQQLEHALTAINYTPKCSQRRMSRELQHFSIATKIEFAQDKKRNRTILSLAARDRPGLLAKIAMVFMHNHIDLQTANVLTFGERAEDVYYITDDEQQPILAKELQDKLREDIIAALH